MRHVPVIALVASLAALLLTPQGQPILGLDHASFARAAVGACLVAWLLLGFGRVTGISAVMRVLSGAVTWTAIIALTVGVYAYRAEFAEFAGRILAELNVSDPEVGPTGEVIVARRAGGEFVVSAKVNGARVPLLFDTGATSVVLTAEDARRAGVNASALDFSVTVSTANGVNQAADVRLDAVMVGPILERNVRALVAKPGALTQSLLGMSFLEKLKSYSVEKGRLVLRGS